MNFLQIRSRMVVATIVAVLAVAGAIAVVNAKTDSRTVTAHFTEAKGIYVGDDVTVLGVPVGTIQSITPRSDDVEIVLTLTDDVELPADVKASIVAESLVSVRTIALGPAYKSGPTLTSGTIPISRTTVPVEWDEMKTQLVSLSKALGPSGANKDGSLSRLVTAGAGFLDGNGAQLNQTITDMSKAVSTLDANSGNLFATVRNLEVFTAALLSSDKAVRTFYTKLAQASAMLAENRQLLAEALRDLDRTFATTTEFLKRNRAITKETLTTLRKTTSMVAARRQDIADLLQILPSTLSNFRNTVNPSVPAVTGELSVANLNNPAGIICGAITSLGGSMNDCFKALQPFVKYLRLSAPPLGLSPLTSDHAGPGDAVNPDGSPAEPRSDTSAPGGDINDLLGSLGLTAGGTR